MLLLWRQWHRGHVRDEVACAIVRDREVFFGQEVCMPM